MRGLLATAAVVVAAAMIFADEAPGASGAPVALTDSAATDSAAREQARLDSLAQVRALSLGEKASDKYRELRAVQYDGIASAQLYPMVADVYAAVSEALADPDMPEREHRRLLGILADLAPLCEKGAVFYSEEHDMARQTEFAQNYVDIRMRPDMKGLLGSTDTDRLYPSVVYAAASGSYNAGDYKRAARYFVEYLNHDTTSPMAEEIATFLGHACASTGDYGMAVERLTAMSDAHPTNFNLLMVTLKNCYEGGFYDKMPPLLERALTMHPDDTQLLALQGALYEDNGSYSDALSIYDRLYQLNPSSLTTVKHLALCYYNLGAERYNRAITEDNEKEVKKLMRQATAYFVTAAAKLEAVIESEPSNPKYLRTLAMTYACLGAAEKLPPINTRLSALGEPTVGATAMPESIVYNDATRLTVGDRTVPGFQEFAHDFVASNLTKWAQRGEFEKTDDFMKRINRENVEKERERLSRVAEKDYLDKYASRLRVSGMELQPYDIDNETYRIDSDFGPIVVKVPLAGKEAETFKNQWDGVKLRNLRYYIENDRVAIAAVDLVTPAGKRYSYSSEAAASYKPTLVTVDISSYLAQSDAAHSESGRQGNSVKVLRAKSDVDRDIPVTTRVNDRTVAMIWANEGYKNVSDVAGALNDGEVFAEYCTSTLGIPERRVMLMENLTYGEMVAAVRKLKSLMATLDATDIIFYYAGHGIPDEGNRESYLLGVDGDGITTTVSYPLKQLYSELTSMNAENVMVFLDACFSGAARDGGMLAEARGVALKPADTQPEGNMMVLSATSDKETALPYREKNHGLFTYYLLKHLQKSKGNISLKELAENVREDVKVNSMLINDKPQNPSVRLSGRLAREWNNKRLRP